MLRRVLILMVAGACAMARAETAATSHPPDETDLQAVAVAEVALEAQAAAGIDTRQAIAHLDQVFTSLEAKYPQSATVLDEHGDFLFAARRGNEAFAKWQQAEKLDGSNADVCEHLGACWLESGDTRRAAVYFQRAVALSPQDASLHFALGNELYLFRHDLTTAEQPETAVVDRALTELRKASELDPLDADYAMGYADTFYSIPVSNWPEALRAWQHFYDISADKDLAAINLARVSLQMKDGDEARRYLALVHGPSFDRLKAKLTTKADATQ
jgi:tetratricopeptide (TPR) repeat protein